MRTVHNTCVINLYGHICTEPCDVLCTPCMAMGITKGIDLPHMIPQKIIQRTFSSLKTQLFHIYLMTTPTSWMTWPLSDCPTVFIILPTCSMSVSRVLPEYPRHVGHGEDHDDHLVVHGLEDRLVDHSGYVHHLKEETEWLDGFFGGRVEGWRGWLKGHERELCSFDICAREQAEVSLLVWWNNKTQQQAYHTTNMTLVCAGWVQNKSKSLHGNLPILYRV